ncbi:MAG: glycosyltransferase family 2 protein [Candidatus Erginobacter occultus]|nr:glycosyltransferase family 2 protein [Candidatus Erginobacter occultus]
MSSPTPGPAEPVDLLLVTRDRRRYLEKTLAHLLADDSPFRLYLWDNGSRDGSAEILAGLEDPRVASRHFSRENRGQREPFLWFLDRGESDLAGKIDDDILVPPGWIGRIAPLLRREKRFGLLGCWTFLPEDWNEELARPKIIELAGVRVFRNLWIGGTAWLARKEHLSHYLSPPGDYGVPLDQYRMTADGLANGYPLPLLIARHLDDPRDPEYREAGDGAPSATAVRKRFRSPEDYGRWIAADARKILTEPLAAQLARYRLRRDPTTWGTFRRFLRKLSARPV